MVGRATGRDVQRAAGYYVPLSVPPEETFSVPPGPTVAPLSVPPLETVSTPPLMTSLPDAVPPPKTVAAAFDGHSHGAAGTEYSFNSTFKHQRPGGHGVILKQKLLATGANDSTNRCAINGDFR